MEGLVAMDMRRELKGLTWRGVRRGTGRYEVLNQTASAGLF